MNALQAILTALLQKWTDPFRGESERGFDTHQPIRPMIAICVGHSRSGDKGAVGAGGVSEWEFWQPLAYRIHEKLRTMGVRSFVCDIYDGNGYGRAMDWLTGHLRDSGATHAVELHFNSAGPTAEGHEWLYWRGSKSGARLALELELEMIKTFPDAKKRGCKPVGRGGRGSLFLRRTPCPAVICEPFFGSNQDEWRCYSEHQEELCDVIALGISKAIR